MASKTKTGIGIAGLAALGIGIWLIAKNRVSTTKYRTGDLLAQAGNPDSFLIIGIWQVNGVLQYTLQNQTTYDVVGYPTADIDASADWTKIAV